MRSLIVEDEFTSRMQIQYFLEEYGHCDIAVNGAEALEAYRTAIDAKQPYDLICLDIRLPKKDGSQVLKDIRKIEGEMGKSPAHAVKIFMTTVLTDMRIATSYGVNVCDEYLTKPIEKEKLVEKLRVHRLIR
jgi:two-component system chemotaxis response regulator CheY